MKRSRAELLNDRVFSFKLPSLDLKSPQQALHKFMRQRRGGRIEDSTWKAAPSVTWQTLSSSIQTHNETIVEMRVC